MRVFCAIALLVLAACSGFGPVRTSSTEPSASPARRHVLPVTMKMSLPYRRVRHRSRDRHSPLYISQYTQTVKMTLSGGPTAFSHIFNVTPGSGACPNAGSTTTCTWTVGLAPGTYRATIVARDASATILSETTGVPAVVAAGKDNALLFTMYAVPTGVAIFLNNNNLSGTSGYFGGIYDLATPLSFSIYLYGITEDGHVQVITGAGSPQLSAKRISGTLGVGLSQPTGNPATFTVSAPNSANLGIATIQVSATFPNSDADICKLPGASCTSSPITFNQQELVAVCCASGLQLYGIDGSGPLATIGSASSGFTAFAVDAQNDIFVASANAVSEYSPPYAGSAAATITNGISGPVAMTASSDGKVFVANAAANPQSVTEYVAPFAGASPKATITNGIALPTPPANAPALSVSNGDGEDTLAVSTASGVGLYASPYAGAAATVSGAIDDYVYSALGTPYGLTSTGVFLCVSSYGCTDQIGAVAGAYALALPSPTNTAAVLALFAASTDGNVYAFNSNTIDGTPTTLSGGFSLQPQLMPENIASDPHGNLAIVNYNGNAVTVHTGLSASGNAAPTFDGSVTLTRSIVHPTQIQILP